jgi:hypothetical protein
MPAAPPRSLHEKGFEDDDSLLLSAPHPMSPLPPYCPSPSSTFQIPKLKLSPLHLLYLLSPLAFIQTTLLAHWTGELDRVSVYLASLSASPSVSSSAVVEGAAGAAADAAVAVAGAGGYLTRLGEWGHLSGLGGFQFLADLSRVSGDPRHVHIGAGWSGGMGWGKGGVDPRVWLLLNGIMAFWLNVVSFNANRRVGALGMTVAGGFSFSSCLYHMR